MVRYERRETLSITQYSTVLGILSSTQYIQYITVRKVVGSREPSHLVSNPSSRLLPPGGSSTVAPGLPGLRGEREKRLSTCDIVCGAGEGRAGVANPRSLQGCVLCAIRVVYTERERGR